jgi:hypothetical protein
MRLKMREEGEIQVMNLKVPSNIGTITYLMSTLSMLSMILSQTLYWGPKLPATSVIQQLQPNFGFSTKNPLSNASI